MSVNGDLLAGIKVAWAANATLVAAVPLTSVYAGSVPATTTPYCVVAVKKEKPPDFRQPRTSGKPYLAYRRVTFTAYSDSLGGAEAVLDLVAAAFAGPFAIANGYVVAWTADDPNDVTEEQERSAAAGPVYSDSLDYVAAVEGTLP